MVEGLIILIDQYDQKSTKSNVYDFYLDVDLVQKLDSVGSLAHQLDFLSGGPALHH